MAQSQTVLASSNFLVPNSTFIAELVAFILILAIVGRYIVPPVQKVMRDRQEIIDKQIEDSEAASNRFAEADAAYQSALVEARTVAANIREGARAEAQSIVEELRKSAQDESARILARGEEQLANQRGIVIRELRGEIGALAIELSEKIIDQRLTDDLQVQATVNAFLADLEQSDSAGSGA